MAVVQISKIQLRRGRRTDLPVLASGELAWCLDTQELYIGSGAVGDGAPAVGNTKILSVKDDLIDLIGTYQYAKNLTYIQTGPNSNYPVENSIQDILDQTVTLKDFEYIPELEDNSYDYTTTLQRAVDQLFLNPVTKTLPTSRVELKIAPGIYNITGTIYLPSYVRLTGSGKNSTIINYTGSGSAFTFINDTSDYTNRRGIHGVDINTSTYNNQPKYCLIKDLGITLTNVNAKAFTLNAVRDSVFDNIQITGAYTNGVSDTSVGIELYSYSSVVTCQRNIFSNTNINAVNTLVYAKQDIINNKFSKCYFEHSKLGFRFGEGADGVSVGEQYGPRKNIIEKSYFVDVRQEGIYIGLGYGNKSINNTFIDVGNNGAGNVGLSKGLYSQIRFLNNGNTSTDDHFDRADPKDVASDLATHNFSTSYIKEVSGKGQFTTEDTISLSLTRQLSYATCVRFPIVGSSGLEINYIIKSTTNSQMRKGTLTISINSDSQDVQLVDDYEYTGPAGGQDKILFKAIFGSQAGSYSGAATILLQYINTNTNPESSTMTYTHRSIS